jgi:hypothetical protein
MPFTTKAASQGRLQPHIIDPTRLRCRTCGADQFACYNSPVCHPDSEAAKKWRRELRDEAVGHAICHR